MVTKIINRLLPILRQFVFKRISVPHVMAFLKYNSMLKILNLFYNFLEKKTGKAMIKSKPFILFLEVTNHCNLNCPFCLTGKRNNTGRPKRNMTFNEMKKAIEAIKNQLYFIQLYNWGEPTLNKDLIKFIDHAHRQKIFTMVSSNMNFNHKNLPEQIVKSGLDYLIAAIDGFSQETYEKYRRGGNFVKAITNLEKIIAYKNANGLHTPFIEWQFVVFRHNQHEIESARQFAQTIGVDYFHPIKGYIERSDWMTTLETYSSQIGLPDSIFDCTRPWTHLNIRVDGGVAACCYEYYKRDDFGNLFISSFDEIWNNEMFKTSRNILSRGVQSVSGNCRNICFDCISKGMRPSFEKQE